MLDLEKLTPAPWHSVAQHGTGKYLLVHGMKLIATFEKEEDCDHAALARNAFDYWQKRDPEAAILWLTDPDPGRS